MRFDITVDGHTKTVAVQRDRATKAYKVGLSFYLSTQDTRKYMYLAYIVKNETLSGSNLIALAVEIAKHEGARGIVLQDASVVNCIDHPKPYQQYNLPFKYLLSYGQTWYMQKGFVPSGPHAKDVTKALAAMPAYRKITVGTIRKAIEAQLQAVERTHTPRTYKPVHGAYKAYSRDGIPLPDTERILCPMRDVLKGRKWLLELMSGVHGRLTLRSWLPKLDCKDYAMFMYYMYGHYAKPAPAVAKLCGISTPSVKEFAAANVVTCNNRIEWLLKIES